MSTLGSQHHEGLCDWQNACRVCGTSPADFESKLLVIKCLNMRLLQDRPCKQKKRQIFKPCSVDRQGTYNRQNRAFNPAMSRALWYGTLANTRIMLEEHMDKIAQLIHTLNITYKTSDSTSRKACSVLLSTQMRPCLFRSSYTFLL